MTIRLSVVTAPPRLAVGALFGLAAVLLCSERLYAGAWTQPAGHGQVILTTSFFETSDAYGPTGNAAAFPNAGHFRQFVVNPYLELGLTPRTTLIFNPSAPWLRYRDQYGSHNSEGFGDVEVAVKRRLNSVESSWATSAQVTVMFPTYSATRNPAPGNHQGDLEGRFLLGKGSNWGARHVFWDAELAYRYRSGAPADQARGDLTGGIEISRRIMLLGQFFAIKGMRNGETARSISNPNAQSDFDLYKSQLSAVVTVTHRTRIQAGWCRTLGGRNTGRGSTAILGLWMTF